MQTGHHPPLNCQTACRVPTMPLPALLFVRVRDLLILFFSLPGMGTYRSSIELVERGEVPRVYFGCPVHSTTFPNACAPGIMDMMQGNVHCIPTL